MINDDLLIDFGPDTYFHLLTNHIDISFLENILITHAHEDHWQPEELYYRREGFASYQHPEQLKPLHVWGSKGLEAGINAYHLNAPNSGLVLHEVAPFERYRVGKYTVTAFPANHAPHLTPVFYEIFDGTKHLLYAHDTGIPADSIWQLWQQQPRHYDMISLDCTGIVATWRDGHMGVPANTEFVQRLREAGCIDDTTIVCLNHFSHNGKVVYDDLAAQLQEKGWLVSYDGMEVEF